MTKAGLDFDVVIVGAGPSGSVAAALLCAKGYRVHIVEKQHFPRFSIGESLLPQCMEFLEEANLLSAVNSAAERLAFQFKAGAAFARGDNYTDFNFAHKFSPGHASTFQVQRAGFDHLLAIEAEKQGAGIAWGHEIIAIDIAGDYPTLDAKDEQGNPYSISAAFVLDASGFGRILPRLLKLDRPSRFPPRTSLFTHIEDNFDAVEFDRDKIRIVIHCEHQDVWFWVIPFANGRSSLGVVAKQKFYDGMSEDLTKCLRDIIAGDPSLNHLLRNAVYDTPVRKITGYSADVSSLHGKGFALLGNAGEFLDPVFSSGVTIAMKSASMAANLVDKQLRGNEVDWENEFSKPLRAGVNTFRVFVEAWYDGRLQDIIFASNQSDGVRQMICSILAGYAWDLNNPYVKKSAQRINTLADICRQQNQRSAM